MTSRIIKARLFSVLMLWIFSFGLAMEKTGSITGKIGAGEGFLLAEVTVTITSPVLMGSRSTVTTWDGSFGFLECPPGEYIIRAELSGFHTAERQGVKVREGETVNITFQLERKPSEKQGRRIRVAMIKAASAWGDVQANIELFEKLALPLRDKGIDVLITPEGFLDGYMVRDKKKCTLEKLINCSVSGPNDPLIRRACDAAKSLNCYLVFGASERRSEGRPYNAAYLIDREGNHVGTFYKVMPNRFYQPGPSLPVFKTDFANVGIVICADRRWPENIRALRLKNAEIILNPTWGWVKGLNTAIMQTRAYENGLPVLFAHPQQSLICGSDGQIAAILESNVPDVLIHDLDLSMNVKPLVNDDKASSHPIQNRRPELWSIIGEKSER